MHLIPLLVQLLIGGLVVYAVYWFIGMLALPEPFKKIVMVVIAIIALLWLLGLFGLGSYTLPIR